MNIEVTEDSAPQDNDCRYWNEIHNVRRALHEGLLAFGYATPVALIFWDNSQKCLRACDDNGLLASQNSIVTQITTHFSEWLTKKQEAGSAQRWSEPISFTDLLSNGILAEGWTNSIKDGFQYVLFILKKQPCLDIKPVQCWVEYSAVILARRMSLSTSLVNGSSQRIDCLAIQSYARTAVASALIERVYELSQGTWINPSPMLNLLEHISSQREEGNKAKGRILFGYIPGLNKGTSRRVDFAEQQRPYLSSYKHVRKLLSTVEGSEYALVCDFDCVLGIGKISTKSPAILAEFHSGKGYLVVDKQKLFGFSDGRFHILPENPDLTQLSTLLRTKPNIQKPDALLGSISKLIAAAQQERHGCTILIDFQQTPLEVPGEQLAVPMSIPSSSANLLIGMTRVDGALHLLCNNKVKGFGCLLYGNAAPNEVRARGARYNSALRFTAQEPDCCVLVVSEDGPVSLFYEGNDIGVSSEYKEEWEKSRDMPIILNCN